LAADLLLCSVATSWLASILRPEAVAVLIFLLLPPPPASTLFPYTTLFRSTWLSRRFQNARKLGRIGFGKSFGKIGIESKVDKLRSEEHTSELQSRENLVCRLLLEKKKMKTKTTVRDRARPELLRWVRSTWD